MKHKEKVISSFGGGEEEGIFESGFEVAVLIFRERNVSEAFLKNNSACTTAVIWKHDTLNGRGTEGAMGKG